MIFELPLLNTVASCCTFAHLLLVSPSLEVVVVLSSEREKSIEESPHSLSPSAHPCFSAHIAVGMERQSSLHLLSTWKKGELKRISVDQIKGIHTYVVLFFRQSIHVVSVIQAFVRKNKANYEDYALFCHCAFYFDFFKVEL